MALTRNYQAGGYGLEIAGKFAGMLKSAEAPEIKGDKADMKTGVANITKKAIANISYGDTKFSVAMSMSKDLQDWIQKSYDMAHEYRDIALLVADFDYKEARRVNIHQALITEVKFSDLDASSKDAVYCDVTCKQEMVRHVKSSGAPIGTATGARMKDWLCANFRIEIPGLDTTFVQKVSLPTFSQKTTVDMVGGLKENSIIPTGVDLGEITVTFGSGPGGQIEDQLMQMADKWFIQGEQVEENHITIGVHFLKPNMKDELGNITYGGCGLMSVKASKMERGDKGRTVEVKWYVETAKCQFQGQG
jgi:hypothetical protein